ncbi:MAG TPA: hypothetical protein VHK88_19305 [Aquihabitans sp.]|jgi:hypothetical protein|nr:hypothetical protein [Aquihabitans sp.]
MAFAPFEQAGIPVTDQFRSWSELNVDPLPSRPDDPYTLVRVILMNGAEVESTLFSHQFARQTDNPELKSSLALSRRVEQQQQKAVNWLLPGDASPLETTISYEQVAVDLTAWLARMEPDPNLQQALNFALLEDFDHLYRYANLYELMEGRHAEEITQHLTEITPGRPTFAEHRHPFDELRPHFATQTVDPLSRLHVMTIVAAEQQTMNYYMNHGPDFMEPIARGLYAEIGQIEEQHVSHYESLLDPLDSWLANLVFHEYNEVYLYWSMLQQETEPRVKALWELHLNMELGQLQEASRLLQKYEGRDPLELLPPELPEIPLTFESNKQYVRDVLAAEVDLRSDGLYIVPIDELPSDHRYFQFQETVNAGGSPTETVIDLNREKHGRDYRDETEGPNPVPSLRGTQDATA